MKKFLLALSMICAGAACFFAASCGGQTYTYTFDTNGGQEIASIEMEGGAEYTLPVPQREGYSFEGWYLTEDFSGEPVTSYSAQGDVTFYARWEQLGVITLDLDGGTLDAGTTLYLAEGENLYNFMQSYTPQRQGLEFGAWFNGSQELAPGDVMGQAVTLTARYTVEYTIEVHAQTVSLDGYDTTEVTERGYVDDTVSVADRPLEGFTRVDNGDQVLSLTLSEDASRNEFIIYYDRKDIQVTFDPNYDGYEGAPLVENGVYGGNFTLPGNSDFPREGYFLAGWSSTSDGNVEYSLNEIYSLAYNGDDSLAVPDDFNPSADITLYAVWVRGYVDMFGGSDYIYLTDEGDEEIYLCRGGRYFIGTYDGQTGQFVFGDSSWDLNDYIYGMLNDNGTFVYSNFDRSEYSAVLFTAGEGVNENVTIDLDDYNGITYTQTSEGEGSSSSTGTYSIDENGLYIITYTEGQLAGQTMVIQLGTVTDTDGSTRAAFRVRNEDEYALGTLARGTVYNGVLTYLINNYYSLTLDGFGSAAFYTADDEYVYYDYVMSDDGTQFDLYYEGQSSGTAKIMQINGVAAYMIYDSDYDHTYTAENGATLTLDGTYSATYTYDGVTDSGMFSVAGQSVFGGTIIIFNGDSGNMTFIITENETGSGEEVSYEYTFAERADGYAEYYYSDEEQPRYDAPLIVLNETREGEAVIYGYNDETEQYVWVTRGAYTYDEVSEQYTYDVDSVNAEADVSTDVMNIALVESVVFKVGTVTVSNILGTTAYDVNYWMSAVIDSQFNEYFTNYVSEDNDRLTLVAGFAILTVDGESYSGTYALSQDNSNLIRITVSGTEQYYYVEIDETDNTFVLLDSLPYSAYELLADGTASESVYIEFDGKGGAVYHAADGTVYSGTYKSTGTAGDFTVYTFAQSGGDLTFTYILPATSSEVYFAVYNAQLVGEYESEEYGTLQLNGYYFNSVYTDAEGNVYEGVCALAEENVLVIYSDDRTIYIDFEGSLENFTVRGAEYGVYAVMDNQAFNGLYVEFDGYGGADVFTYAEDAEDSRNYIDEQAVYAIDGEEVVISYTDGSEAVALYGIRGSYTLSSGAINVYIIGHEEIVRTFINDDDWSVYVFDAYGNATMYSQSGVEETGTYALVTDDLLYYVNDEATDASLFTYNAQTGIMSPIALTTRAYYSQNLDTMYFTRYGFVLINGESRYYYNIEDGSVVIYRQDAPDDQAVPNEYGFYEQDFGSFEETVNYDGIVYVEGDGYTINFSREEQTAENYPVPVNDGETVASYPIETLRFLPTGTQAEYVIDGTVRINGKDYNCSVVRESDGNGGYEMYIAIFTQSTAYFRMDIDVNYSGADNATYEVTGMSYVNTAYSYNYLSIYALYYTYFGSWAANSLTNTYGLISMVSEYDVAGEVVSTTLDATFGVDSGMYDVTGEIISLEDVAFEYDEENYIYSASFTGNDGYEYTMYFTMAQVTSSLYGYQMIATVRTQEITDEQSGITVQTGVVISSDVYEVGELYPGSVGLVSGGENIAVDSVAVIDGELYFIVRTTEEGVTSTTYYNIDLTEAEGGVEYVVPVYESVSVSSESVTTYYTADGQSYIDVDAQNNVLVVTISDGETADGYVVTESSYDAVSRTYTVTASTGDVYTVTLGENDVITITLVEEPASEGEDEVA